MLAWDRLLPGGRLDKGVEGLVRDQEVVVAVHESDRDRRRRHRHDVHRHTASFVDWFCGVATLKESTKESTDGERNGATAAN